MVHALLTGAQYTGVSFTTVTSKLPVTWSELEACLVRVTSVGGGAGSVGYAWATITFTAAGVYQRSATGYPVRLAGGDLFQFVTQGRSWQLAASASMAVGPLVRID